MIFPLSLLLFAFATAVSFGEASPDLEGLALRRIADFWQEGEYQIAKNQMEKFLAEFPTSPHAGILSAALGDLYLREKSYNLALERYAQIPTEELRRKVFLNRMQCLYHLQWHATLADECEAFLSSQPPPDPQTRLQAAYLTAIALYQQAVNLPSGSNEQKAVSDRALPYFESLSQSELGIEANQAFAHLCCLRGDYQRASELYLDMAKGRADSDKFLFQAALLQSQWNKEKALASFEELARSSSLCASEAAFNRYVLLFEMGRFQDVVAAKDETLRRAPQEKRSTVLLLAGKSHLELQQPTEAVTLFSAVLSASEGAESARPVLLHLMEAAYQSADLSLLDRSIETLRTLSPNDSELPKALLSRAQLLKQRNLSNEAMGALEQLLVSFQNFADRPYALFELAHLAAQEKNWPLVRKESAAFLEEFPAHELASFARRYLATAAIALAQGETDVPPENKRLAASDLAYLLQAQQGGTAEEKDEWAYALAKIRYELHQFEEAKKLLEPLVEHPNPQQANAMMLLALVWRDGFHNEPLFTQWAERALAAGQSLLPEAQLHVSLFNSYVVQGRDQSLLLDVAADHLRSAFAQNAEIQLHNLVWLADHSYLLSQKDVSFALPAAQLFLRFVEKTGLAPDAIGEANADLELFFLNIAKLFAVAGQSNQVVTLLQPLIAQYSRQPLFPWKFAKEARLLLAESYEAQENIAGAIAEYAAVGTLSPSKRDPIAAKAALKWTRLYQQSGVDTPDSILPTLKDLVLQRSFANEPIHLEAAIDYLDLQTAQSPVEQRLSKRCSLLQKTIADFESEDDLLGKDYHAARARYPEKNNLYLAYMQFLRAELLLAEGALSTNPDLQKELQAKAKELLLQLKGSQLQRPIAERVHSRLQSLMSSDETAAS